MSRPNRIGATVNAIRSSVNACATGSPRSARADGMGVGRRAARRWWSWAPPWETVDDASQQLRRRSRRSLHALALQRAGDRVEVDAFRGGGRKDRAAQRRGRRRASAPTSPWSANARRVGCGHGVDDAGRDQPLDVEDVGVARVLRPGARPQRALRASRRRAPAPPSARRRSAPGSARRRAARWRSPRGRAAARRRASTASALASMRETKNEATEAIPLHRLARGDAALEPAQVGLDHLVVALDGEQQRHVDVDAAGGQLLDRPRRPRGSRAP